MITSKTFKKDLFLLFFLIILNNVFSQNIQKNGIDLLITENPFSLKIIDLKTNKTLLESNGDILIEHIIGSYPYKNKPYIKWKTGKTIAFKNTKNVIHKSKFENWNLYEIGDDDNNPLIRFKYKILELNKIQLEFEEINPILENETQHSRIQINFKSDRLDSFLGMGMRFNKVNHYGTIVTNWCNEVGENLPIVAKKKTEEGQDITYAPIPFFLNLKGYGLLLNSFYYSEFDFAKTNKNVFSIKNYSNKLNIEVFTGEKPIDIVGSYFKSTGNYKKPKPWAFGVWASATSDWQSKVKGETENYKVLKTCRDNKIPLSAIMAEDWFWSFLKFPEPDSWELNRSEYPNFENMIADQHKSGVKHISYFLPYFAPKGIIKKSKNYQIAKEKQYFTKNANGDPAVFNYFIWKESQIDPTNPEAIKWFQDEFYTKMTNWGSDGWMNDFGEYTPYDSHSYNGELGLTMHNKYPLYWAKMAKDFWSKKQKNADYTYFSRSGSIGQLSNTAFLFTGDRNANYDYLSGFGGQITGVLSGSISAHPNISIDIGAYNCEGTKPMNKLMMYRWIELGALIPVMRLHRGLPLCDHWRFDEDTETLQQWKKYATLHGQLFPYFYTLAQEAEDKGYPMIRHLSMYNSKDEIALKQDFEFLLGDRILVAPVIYEQEPISKSDLSKANLLKEVYLPQGKWYHFWTNKKYDGIQSITVESKPGFLPFFIQEGKVIPMFDSQIDTFVENVVDEKINDYEIANKSLEIRFYGFGKDSLKLWDGTIINCSREIGEKGKFSISNNIRNYKAVFID